MAPDATLTWSPRLETDLRLTVARLGRGPGDPTHRLSVDGTLWRTTLTEAGPATMRLSQGAAGRLRCDAWGAGAAVAAASAPVLLGADDDPETFEPGHPVLADAHRRYRGLRLPKTGRIFESLVPAILEQRVQTIAAHASYRRLVVRYGTPAPGPTPVAMRVPPAAEAWRMVPSWEWHRAGVDPQRSQAIVRAARVADRLEEAARMTPDDAETRLRAVPGIGVWTAAEVLQRAVGSPDHISVGDYHLSNYIGHAFAGRDMTDEEMIIALEPWRGHRYRVVRLLEASGVRGKPRRAPRAALTDHTGR